VQRVRQADLQPEGKSEEPPPAGNGSQPEAAHQRLQQRSSFCGGQPRAPPRYWKNPYKRRALSQLDNNLNTEHKLTDDQTKAINTRAAPLQQLAKEAAESNWCYQDNWNHL